MNCSDIARSILWGHDLDELDYTNERYKYDSVNTKDGKYEIFPIGIKWFLEWGQVRQRIYLTKRDRQRWKDLYYGLYLRSLFNKLR